MLTYHLISLGCAKNLVDSEVMLGDLQKNGWQLCETPEESNVLIVNTCGFIQPAVEEAIEEILELVRIKESFPDKKIVVAGCMVQRYHESLEDELPEVDLFLGTEGPSQISGLLEKLLDGTLENKVMLPETFLMDYETPRLLSTPQYHAWLKITEGCDNRCTYCMIPSIRGNLRSRSVADLTSEAARLEKIGVKELSLIAQDSTAYGNDLDNTTNIVTLLQGLLKSTTIPWLRLLYLYPTGVTEELVSLMAKEDRIVPYLDIPFQHVNDQILHRMNRPYGYQKLADLVAMLRKEVPGIALRTTFLVGFPGETEEQFLEIENFIRDFRLDHVGVFPYSNEEGARSEYYPDQLPEEEKLRRRDHLLKVQAEVSESLHQKYVGRVEDVLVEGVSAETNLLLEGRTRFQAPEVDGCVYINEGTASPGDIVKVAISEAKTYDLIGGIVS